jgi:DNA polymerase elongation subunit (family B)
MSDMRILTLDIETSPNLVYAWGLWNQNIAVNQIVEPTYILSWAAKWVGEDKITYRDHDAPDFLDAIWKMINEADAIVTYNGIAFDMKHLQREFAEAGMVPPYYPKQIDLYHTVKKQFKFASNKLDYVAKRLLGEEKVGTGGMGLWIACLNGEAWAWKKMKEYNIGDVKLTEKLYLKIRGWITNHPNHGLFVEDQENPVCRNCGSDHVISKGPEYRHSTNVFAYQRYKCRDCGANLRGRSAVKGKRKNSRQVLTS